MVLKMLEKVKKKWKTKKKMLLNETYNKKGIRKKYTVLQTNYKKKEKINKIGRELPVC